MKAISQAPKNKCITKARNGAKFPQIETQVCAFIHQKRNDGFRFSMSLICQEALRVARQLGISETDFNASPGWYNWFMNRKGYSIRAGNIRQRLRDQATPPADQIPLTATENPETSTAATAHVQETPPAVQCPVPSTENPEASNFQEVAMSTSELITMLSDPSVDTLINDACKIPGDQGPIPSTEDPEASKFQEWSIRSSDLTTMLSDPLIDTLRNDSCMETDEQLDLNNFSFDTAKFDDMPWYSAYCSLQKNNELSYTMLQPMSLG